MYNFICQLLHYEIARYIISVIVALMLMIAFGLAVLGIVYYFADRKINESYKSWRGKK